jgi:hypothetical protein
MRVRDRAAFAERHPFSKLTTEKVEAARHQVVVLGRAVAAVAREIGATREAVTAAVKGANWRRAGGPTAARTLLYTKGEQQAAAKLTNEDVKQIREMRHAGASIREVAKKFQMDPLHLRRVAIGELWSHLNEIYPPIKKRPAFPRRRK